MKKLVIYDHLGIQQFQTDLFVDGQDFTWTSPRPQALWLGTIKVQSLEDFNKEHGIRAIEPLPPHQQIFKPEEVTTQELKADQDAAATKEHEEVAQNEPKKVDNQSTGESGSSEASQSESLEGLSKGNSGKHTTKRGKRSRDSKAN